MKIKYLSLLVIPLLLAACGGGEINDGNDIAGIVQGKIAPQASADCDGAVFAIQCTSGDKYRIVLEPLPGEKYVASGWYDPIDTVCLAPSEWRTLKIGDQWKSGHGYSDLHCDG